MGNKPQTNRQLVFLNEPIKESSCCYGVSSTNLFLNFSLCYLYRGKKNILFRSCIGKDKQRCCNHCGYK